jgi:hypothetical protein
MYIIEVIQKGTGIWIDGFGSRDKVEATKMLKTLKGMYPNDTVMMEWSN